MKKAPGRKNQRKFDRKPAELPVIVRAAGTKVQAGIHLDSLDVSEGGAFLRSQLLFEVGQVLQLEIPLPSGQTVKATGKVVRVNRPRNGDEGVAGMGIEFTRLAMNDRRAIATSLAEMFRVKPTVPS
ncbi:MAG TPA: PilZ domain-containing protein [Polyangia bacterium]